MEIKESLKERAGKTKLLLLDVDGVLTDGRIIYDSKGRDSKFFDVHDGLGVYLLKKAGGKQKSKKLKVRFPDKNFSTRVDLNLPI